MTDTLYAQVVEALRDEINRGVHAVGHRLPTEDRLATRFGVSRHTIREALRQLRADGLVQSRRGSGTQVMRPGAPHVFVHEIGSLGDLIHYAASTRYHVDHTELIATDDALAQRLGGKAGDQWLRVSGFRHVDEASLPLCFTMVYVPAAFAGIARLVGRRPVAVHELVEDLYGVRFAEVDQVVHARPVPDDLHERLAIEPGALVIEVIRTYRLSSGQIAQVAVNLYPADRFSMSMRLRNRGG